MSKAFSIIFWGAVITVFNINIGRFNLLPTFAGYIVIASGLSKIAAPDEGGAGSVKKARALAWALAVYSFIMIFMSGAFGGVTNSILSAAFMTVDMIMCYFILSAGAGGEISVLKQQKYYLLAATAAVASSCAAAAIPEILWAALFLSLASKIYFICLCYSIKRKSAFSD